MNPGSGKTAGCFGADLGREPSEVPAQGGEGIGKDVEAGIATDFAHRAKDADCAKLFENIGVA